MIKKLFSLLPLVLILSIAFLLRIWQIDTIAPDITIDELDYTLTAKSFYLSGSDLKNHTSTLGVLAFHYPSTDEVKAELPYLLQIPFAGPFPFSLPLARLPFIFLNVGTVLLLYALGKELVSKEAGIAAGLLGAINPFLVVIGRTSYDISGVTFFYLAALFTLIKLKGWKIFWSLPLFIAAFYMYIGTKLLFIPFVLWSVGFAYFFVNKRKFARQYVLFLGVICIFVGYFFLSIHTSSSSRLSELFSPNSPTITSQVNTIRHLSLRTPLTPIIINKYTIFARDVINSFFTIFSFDFVVGHGEWFFRLYNHGVMYYIDIIFLIASAIFFGQKKKQVGFFLLGCIVIATFPQIFHKDASEGTNYAHAAFVFPFLVLCAGIGIAFVISQIPKKLRDISIGIITCLYIFSLAYFVHAYFFQYGLVGRDEFSVRELSRYINLSQQNNQRIFVMTPIPQQRFKKYLFYTNTLNATTIRQVKKAFITNKFIIKNVSFISCPKTPFYPQNTIVIEDTLCKKFTDMTHTNISQLTDGGTNYRIYNDTTCGNYQLLAYPSNITLSDLRVETLSRTSFCQKFITR